MPHTFEEIAAQELDSLYQGALFLCVGVEREAEDLLVRTLTEAFHVFRAPRREKDGSTWLHGRLVLDFLKGAGGWKEDFGSQAADDANGAGREPKNPPDHGVDQDALYRAAGSVPAGTRAALWLVMFLRWSYEKVRDLLGVGDGELRGMLKYRDAFVAAAMKVRGRRGSDDGTAVT